MSALSTMRTKPRLWVSAALVTAGLAGGGVLGTTLSAGAATTSTNNGSAAATSPSTGTDNTPPGPPGMPHGQCHLPDSGTVTAIGSNSVTIDGKTYTVTSSSDIDKNGEATLSSLAVGDKVTFSTVASASTPTIDRLHAGNEALNRPNGPPPGAPAPSGNSSSGTSSSSSSTTGS